MAPFPGFVQLVGSKTDGLVFFIGSLFFTSAALLQWLETIDSHKPGGPGRRTRRRFVTWEPRSADWWSSLLQLFGTIFFNISTFRALTTATGSGSYNRLVWRPDALGSVCFLVSGCLAFVVVAGALLRRPPATADGRIATSNLLGCLAFAISAVAGYVLPTTGEAVNVTIVNAATALGALGFLVGALLLLRQGRHLPGSPAH